MDQTDPQRYFDRELSWIDFNGRVLGEAADTSNPLLERLKFIGIVSSNFDEFFMVRIPSLSESDPMLHPIYEKAFDLMKRRDDYFLSTLVPQLQRAGIRRVLPQSLAGEQLAHIKNLFYGDIFPLLTPIAVREEAPMPLLGNLSLYCAVKLTELSKPESHHFAVIEIPKNLPRLIELPSETHYDFILIEDVILLFAKELFQGYEIVAHGLIRLTRAAELTLDEEKDEDFSKVMTEALRTRRKSYIVRLEACGPGEIIEFLRQKMGVRRALIHRTNEWLDLKSISTLAFQPGFQQLKRPTWAPRPIPELERAEDIWSALREKDFLVHYPYDSFDAFVRFITEAAEDPDVLAIKQTLYRTGKDSAVISALERAALNGKQVTALVELKARFDEQRNIEWANRLANAGVNVLYGVVGLKTHAKACLVMRREWEGIRRYLNLSTGNYHEKTACLYSDTSYFTADEQLTRDIALFFNVITGISQPTGFSKIEIAPSGLRRKIERLILREASRSRKEQPGLIMAKMNSLVDPRTIEALYRASQAGVRILLNARGICCLRPGVPGMSENIKVVSIVDMFLEHSRIFYFRNGGDEEVFLSSADWMPRNFDKRLEMMFPIEQAEHKRELIALLEGYFKDNVKSWQLTPNGEYQKKEPRDEKPFRIQECLCNRAVEKEEAARNRPAAELKPQKPKSEPRGNTPSPSPRG